MDVPGRLHRVVSTQPPITGLAPIVIERMAELAGLPCPSIHQLPQPK